MKPTTFIVSLLTFLVITFDVSAQQHLEPTRYPEVLKGYHEKVFPLLRTGFSEKPEAQYTVIPSFSAEYALSVEQKSNRYYLISNTLSDNYWYSHNKSKVNVISNSFEIDATLYQAIVELFNTATAQIKELEIEIKGHDGVTYIAKRDSIGRFAATEASGDIIVMEVADGTTHYFATTDSTGNTITGEIWSPNKNTLMHGLVKISDDLCALSSKDSENKIAPSEIEKRINLLIIDMKKEAPTQ